MRPGAPARKGHMSGFCQAGRKVVGFYTPAGGDFRNAAVFESEGERAWASHSDGMESGGAFLGRKDAPPVGSLCSWPSGPLGRGRRLPPGDCAPD